MRRAAPKRRRAKRWLFLLVLVALMLTLAKALNLWHGQVSSVYAVSGGIEVGESVPDRKNYVSYAGEEISIREGLLVLVREGASYVGADNLVGFKEYKENEKDTTRVSREMAGPLREMMEDYGKKYPFSGVRVLSGYRTHEEQAKLLREKIAGVGEQEARRWVAYPGESEHHTGLAVDFCTEFFGAEKGFDGEGDLAWFSENAYRYGFVERYIEGKEELTGIHPEPWHYRYVGVPHAGVMKYQGFCLEEYVSFLKGFPGGKRHLTVRQGDRDFEIYYVCEGTDLLIPSSGEYTVSGNNIDGYIITIEK